MNGNMYSQKYDIMIIFNVGEVRFKTGLIRQNTIDNTWKILTK